MSPDQRRATIIEATIPLLEEHGGSVSTKQIAEAAGIAEGTIFRVFADKRELFHAAAHQVLNPPAGREELADALNGLDDLHDKVEVVVGRLVARTQRGMAVMMALRSMWMAQGAPAQHAEGPPGPPAFVAEANHRLLVDLAEVVFAPHADQLRIAPDRAAMVLRSLVLGGWHPGMPGAERPFTPAEIADLVLGGVLERGAS